MSFERFIMSFERYDESLNRDICYFDFRSNVLPSISHLIDDRKENVLLGFRKSESSLPGLRRISRRLLHNLFWIFFNLIFIKAGLDQLDHSNQPSSTNCLIGMYSVFPGTLLGRTWPKHDHSRLLHEFSMKKIPICTRSSISQHNFYSTDRTSSRSLQDIDPARSTC